MKTSLLREFQLDWKLPGSAPRTARDHVADEWLEDSISMWDYILGTFDKTVRECEEPAAKDERF